MREDLPTGHLALLLTDIEGSTRLLYRLGAAGYGRAQAHHRDLLRQAFRSNRGVEVDTQGDAFFYVFPDALHCLQGAVAAQRALARFDWPHGREVKVRMGMHVGDPERTEEGYVGVSVNLAARISSAGHGGQILISSQAAAEIEKLQPDDGITLRDLGNHRLKDMDEEARLYQAVIPELPSDFSPPRTAATRPNNLPISLTPFIGRAELVADVRDLLARDDTRVVSLLGPGGTGKTRLGLRVASELLHSLEDGAFFVPLASIRDPGLVPGAVAAALELRESQDEPLEESVLGHLEDKELLLLLDNFEQVQGANRFVADLLKRCAGVKVLTTSRQPLRISGEKGVRVPPLALPDEGVELSVDEIGSFEAVRLFVDRAQSIQWDFGLSDANAREVVEICRRVDALPLAIELATARLYDMTTTELLASLEERMRVLTDGAVDLLDHQRTLRDLIAWSYEMLDPALQRMWRRLSVFAGGWTVEAAETICDLGQPGDVQRCIDELVQRSLVTIAADAASSAARLLKAGMTARRYTMLETLREFAADQLDATPEAETIRDRFRDWFLALAEDSKASLRGADSARALAALHPDVANFRAVMQRCTDAATVDPDNALRLGTALWFFWYSLGYMSEGRELLRRAIEVGQEADPAALAAALLAEATILRQQNLIDEASGYAEKSLALSRAQNDAVAIAAALSELGAIAQRRQDYDQAEALLDEAVDLLRVQDSSERLAVALNLLGIVKQLRGNVEAAQGHYKESLALGRQLADQNVIGTALVNLGEIAQLEGDVEGAASWFRQSLSVWSEVGQGLATVYCLEVLAGIDADAGRGEEAALLFGAAARLREEQEIPIEAYNLERYEGDLTKARSASGTAEFDAAWAQGRKLKLDEVVALAMADKQVPASAR